MTNTTTVLPSPLVEVKEPSLYQVLLHNDDYTPMDFVVEILEEVFRKDRAAATKIMLDVHRKGVGVCGIFTHEVAETKVVVVHQKAQEQEYPLKCTLEKAT